MKVTSVLLPITVTLAVLVTFKITGTTSTSALPVLFVLFSFEVAFATLVKLPTVLVLAVIHNLTELLLTISAIFQLIKVLPSVKVRFSAVKSVILDPAPTSTKPAGK